MTALHHINLSIRSGEFVLVTGPSGSGKSTLARCLNGLIPHATKGTMGGTVIVNGMDTRDHDVPEFASQVGMVFQDPGTQLVTGDVESEIAFGLEIRNLPGPEIRTRLDRVAGILRIRHLLGRPIRDLSWGERQRVAVASVLAVRPSLLAMDEPFSGLDASAAQNLAELLTGLKADLGTTVIIFEHRTGSLFPIADRLVVMQGGGIVYDGKPGPSDPAPIRENEGFRKNPAVTSISSGPANLPDPGTRTPGRQSPVPSLSLRDVQYRYPGARAPALEGITVDFYPGEITIISGANGSGKTTLLKHCNGLLLPDRGNVYLGPEPVRGKTVAAAAHTVGLLNQHADYQLFGSTIAEELAFGPRNLGMTDSETDKNRENVRRSCFLDHIDPSTPPLSLSGGEKQRVAIAGILTMDTPVVILDEPTFGLDPGLKRAFALLFRRLSDRGKTVIIATHDDKFGISCGDRFIRVSAGRIEDDYRRSRAPGTGCRNEQEDVREVTTARR